MHRRDFIETPYVQGVVGVDGTQAIRPLNEEETAWLNNYYKQQVHGTFITDDESKLLFKKAKSATKKRQNIEYFETHGKHPQEVLDAVEAFNAKSKALGNLIWNFWDQREINSDDYKRKTDVLCNSSKGLQLDSFEDIQYIENVDEKEDTYLEDLITESEE